MDQRNNRRIKPGFFPDDFLRPFFRRGVEAFLAPLFVTLRFTFLTISSLTRTLHHPGYWCNMRANAHISSAF